MVGLKVELVVFEVVTLLKSTLSFITSVEVINWFTGFDENSFCAAHHQLRLNSLLVIVFFISYDNWISFLSAFDTENIFFCKDFIVATLFF